MKKQKRIGGGNRRSDAVVTVRRSKVLARVKAGEPVTAIAKAVETPYRTVQSDLSALRLQLLASNKEAWEAYRSEVRSDLLALRDKAESLKGKEAIDAALSCIDRLTRLDGLNAPDKSVSVKVSATSTGLQYQFLEHAGGLSESQLSEVFAFMDSLPRKRVTPDISGFLTEGKQ